MQRRSNINLNSAGFGSCLLLLLLAFLVVNPVIGLPVYAEESGDDSSVATDDKTRTEPTDEDYAISTYSTTTPSSVTLSFDKTAAESSVTPINSTAMPVYADVVATVTIADSGGYSVYVGSTSLDNNLTNGEHIITPISDTDCNSGVCDLASIPVGKWGYSFKTITNPQTEEADHTSYEAVPLNLRTNAKDSGGVTKAQIEKKYALSFAANVNSTTASGTYTGSVTMSVVSSPRQVVFDDITTMQQMSTPICTKADIGDTKQLQDTRDNKFYWVTKLRDGNCWMTQNLDLDILTSGGKLGDNDSLQEGVWPEAAKSDYDTAPTIKIYATSTKVVNNKTTNSSTPYTASWSLGDVKIANPTTSDNCGSGAADAAACGTRFTAYTTPTTLVAGTNYTDAHYILGNHYQWTVANAGTTDGSKSICPKGWKLPTSNSTTASGSFGYLISGISPAVGTVAALASDPYYFVRGGLGYQNDNLLSAAGNYGRYWSSTPNANYAYNLDFYDDASIDPPFSRNQAYGLSVRCVAR